MPVCREFHFVGMVQGVGFRWTVKRLADAVGVGGWVRNNSDGSVTLAALGSDAAVEELLTGITDEFGQYIQSVESRDVSPIGLSDDFAIVR